MAHQVSADEVFQQISEDSDWYDSEDDLVGDGQEGEIDRYYPQADDTIDRVQNEPMDDDLDIQDQLVTSPSASTTDLQAIPRQEESSCGISSDTDPSLDANVGVPHHSSVPDFTHVPGPRTTCHSHSHPYDFFEQIWSEDTFKHIARQTNVYAAQKGTPNWEDVSEDEMKSFLGIHLAMGVVQLPSLQDYWSTHPLVGTPGIVRGMSQN